MSLEFSLFEKPKISPINSDHTKNLQASNLFETKHHSWYGKRSHIIRANRQVIRCQILKIVVMHDNQVGIELMFKETKKNLRKIVSPMFVAAMRVFWLNRDIVSEDEDQDDETNDEKQVEFLKSNLSSVDQTLPELRLLPTLGIILTPQQQRPLEFVLRQTQIILSLI